jgi:uncharacterized protein (DUF924 family)
MAGTARETGTEVPATVTAEAPDPGEVLAFWFPDPADVDPDTHLLHWRWRMQGGADEEIVRRFSDLTAQAAVGQLDHWAADPRGRLALIIALDQFPRSVWRGSPRAFAQDEKALALVLEGYGNGHYDALETPWERTVYNLPMGHCEGPDHLDRLDRAIQLAQDIHATAPDHLKPGYAFAAQQPVEVRKVIAAFGRHPHRNAILSRASTPEEEPYLAEGKFPHLRDPDQDDQEQALG